MIQTSIDGISFELRQPFDFSFLHPYGRVFRVFDNQDSGNICFGLDREGERFFVKFAGAPTRRACVSASQAMVNLKATVVLYRELQHELLVELLETFETDGGFGMVFRWTDGECMGKMYPEARRRFMEMPMETRLAVYGDIQRFLAHVAAQNYVAIDFYDGSILYDFAQKKTVICDIDFFRKQPCVNDMGRMWGSSRFQAPEEYELGAAIDEITNVYTLGAAAFALFAQDSREEASWPLSQALYRVARTAVSPQRSLRQPSIRAFMQEWEGAMRETPRDI